jgi:hypothetical protein
MLRIVRWCVQQGKHRTSRAGGPPLGKKTFDFFHVLNSSLESSFPGKMEYVFRAKGILREVLFFHLSKQICLAIFPIFSAKRRISLYRDHVCDPCTRG